MSRSTAILEKMKRSLGLHCTILRIHTSGSETDISLEKSLWLSAEEELHDLENPSEQRPTLSTSDIQNIQQFTRDLVTQSVVPHMERCISMWNDQVSHKSSETDLDRLISPRISW